MNSKLTCQCVDWLNSEQGRPQIHGRGCQVLAPGCGLLLAHEASPAAPPVGERSYALDTADTIRYDSGSDRCNPAIIPETAALPNERSKEKEKVNR